MIIVGDFFVNQNICQFMFEKKNMYRFHTFSIMIPYSINGMGSFKYYIEFKQVWLSPVSKLKDVKLLQ